MVDTIYVESSALEHEISKRVLSKYPKAEVVEISHYGEVFNSTGQNFRIQKSNPSLILARKEGARVISTPAQYETGGGHHYYFSHMLNCVYDCRYCFLQGMLRSANYLLFVNYEDFLSDISRVANEHIHEEKPTWFFSGYDCDSLAYEPITGFADHFVSKFESLPNSVLELRTKSTQIRSLLSRKPVDNIVVAFSLAPDQVAREIEHGAPSFEKRLKALEQLQAAGWRIGIRFDPVIWHAEYLQNYERAIQQTFSTLRADAIDSVTLGGFRMPKDFYKKTQEMYPENWMLNIGLEQKQGMVHYRADIESQVLQAVGELCLQHIDQAQLFVYRSDAS